jgi:Mg2+-importing ATPase
MIVFGLLSTIFDYITFGILFFVLHSVMSQFRTAWFTESVISASMVVLVIRTRRSLFSKKSRPRKYLLLASLSIVGITIVLPFIPVGQVFGFVVLPPLYLPTIGVIVLLYVITAESAKKIFYRRVKF